MFSASGQCYGERPGTEKRESTLQTAKVDQADWLTVGFCGLNEREQMQTSQRTSVVSDVVSIPLLLNNLNLSERGNVSL